MLEQRSRRPCIRVLRQDYCYDVRLATCLALIKVCKTRGSPAIPEYCSILFKEKKIYEAERKRNKLPLWRRNNWEPSRAGTLRDNDMHSGSALVDNPGAGIPAHWCVVLCLSWRRLKRDVMGVSLNRRYLPLLLRDSEARPHGILCV
jgi:hypothetical protein